MEDFKKNLKMSAPMSLVWLVGAFGMGLVISSFLVMVIGSDIRWKLLVGTAAQNIFAFILPAFLVAMFSGTKPLRYLGLLQNPGWRRMAMMIIMMFAAIPLINQTALWNLEMHLPDSMKALEQALRGMEETAEKATQLLLGDTSVIGLISGILFIGVLTGFAEELFFRSALQTSIFKALGGTKVPPCSATWKTHAAVWITAIIFSAMHMQFFGFLPRLIMGLMFGYFFAYGGSVWVNATAHTINNSMVVLISWLSANGYISEKAEDIGTSTGVPWAMIISLAILLGMYAIYAKIPMNKENYGG